jgi:hypothetical protein
LNSDKIWKIQKKIVKKIGKIQKKSKLNSDKIWKIRKKGKLNSEMIGTYGGKVS